MIQKVNDYLDIKIWINKNTLIHCRNAYDLYIKEPTKENYHRVLRLGGYSKQVVNELCK
jgi:hypothetical protein